MRFEQAWARVMHGDGTAHGYALTGTKALGGGKTLVLTRGDPGFRITEKGMKMAKFPHWDIDGENRLEIFSSACVDLRSEEGADLRASLAEGVAIERD